MADKQNKREQWLNVAYELFADQGPSSISIKELASASQLSRTNFYYHFSDKEELIDELLKMHLKAVESSFNTLLNERVQNFIPDLYVLAEAHKINFRFQWQLFRQRKDMRYNYAYLYYRKRNSEIMIPLIIQHYKLNLPLSMVQAAWDTVSDARIAHVDFNDFKADALAKLADEIMKSVLAFVNVNK
ncbi:TetR/AcrR family transcriptional regulator [Carboxylicivirga sp. M1479]|uniref:TetR/AcrR family transcriptional regulator n=1 Tax=Carboxylicivirga sp. M1479 TaxID=2594476 RepID=UPI001178C46E|nr:TetR/AcrR family transcriptional regulator [Carboxylicivirga sp. M1479]TRX62998.1 TetR/AcrR family transcriptional regulator [Carboxylicivirga sp. M1479]